MDITLQTLLQNVADPLDLADSISAFIQNRTSMYGPTLEKLSGVIEGDITYTEFINDQSILHKVAINLGDDVTEARVLDLDEIATTIFYTIEDEDANLRVAIYDASGTFTEFISLDEALDRFHDIGAQSDMLVTALNIISQYIDSAEEGMDFILTSFAKIDGYLSDSALASRLKGIFVTMAEELQEAKSDPVSLLESCLAHFGFSSRQDDPRANDASMYTGQSARNTLFSQACQKVGWAIAQIPSQYQFILGIGYTIGLGIRYLLENAYKGLQALTETAIAKIFELDDGIQKTAIPGRGYIQHPGFAIKFDDQHTSFPGGADMAEAYTDLWDALGDKAQSQQQYTIPVGPLVMYLNWMVDHAEITYDLRPIDYQVYTQVFNEHFGSNPKLFIKATGGVIEADNTGITLENLTRQDLINFVKDLYSRNKIWTMDFKFDSQRYMCIQCCRHLLTILIALSKSTISTVDYSLANELNDAWLYMDVTEEYGYNTTSHAFIPENINFASICTYMCTRSSSGKIDIFNSRLKDGNVLDLTDMSDYSWLVAVNMGAIKMLGKLAAVIISNDPSSAGNYFVPYFHKFKRYRPSYYIPTDSDNVTLLKRMIVTGIAVIGVIAVVVASVYIGSKFKKKKWMMEQQAAQKAFTASETHNAALLAEGWKQQKRANLLGSLAGTAEMAVTPISTGVAAVYSSIKDGYASASTGNISLSSILHAIKG